MIRLVVQWPVSRDPSPSEVPWRDPTLPVIFGSTGVLAMGVPLLSPVLPAIRDFFVVTDATASLLITLYFLPGVALSPVLGALSDRWGRRRVLVPALVVFALCGGLVSLGVPLWVVFACRLVQGTAAAAVFIVTVTLVGDVFAGVQRNAVLGVNTGVLFSMAALYPLVGGVLVAFGWSVPFAVYLLALPVAAFAWFVLQEPERERATGGLAYVRGAVAALPTVPAVGLYGATLLVELVGFGVILTGTPFLLADAYGAAPVVIGAVITANTLAAASVALLNGWFARRVRNRRLVAAGFVVVGASSVGAWAAGSPLQFAVAAVAFGAGVGLVLPSVDAAIVSIAPSTYRAGALSLRNSATFLGRATGPVVFALAASVAGYRPAMAVAGAVLLVLGLGAVSTTAS